MENVGARRLHALLEELLEEISFDASDHPENPIIIDKAFVSSPLCAFAQNVDLSKFIL